MNFNGQPNMFFGMFISFTCDLHLKLDILNPFNIIFLSKKFLNELVFIKFIQWTCTFIEGGMVLLYKKIEINCMVLCLPFDLFFKMYFIHLIPLVYKTQKDINIISNLF
jgi:hypothetical protein